jgi:hypothetical protein
MFTRLLRWFAIMGAFLFCIAGCGQLGAASSISPTVSRATSTSATSPAQIVSTASFTLTGGANASYTLRAVVPTSKLRHGHREFTINIESAGISLFIVFYGYQGPGSYTLTNAVNGGDTHIGLQNDERSWDLFLQPTASCSLVVMSETPTSSTGIDKLQGRFACPRLFSSSPAHPQQPVAVQHGIFDLAIIVES